MTTLKTPIILLAFSLLLSATGCRDPLPCPDCDEQADDSPLPDLPCDGADLMNDNLNCGTCGHECTIWRPDTEWEAGSCQAGECGPVWSPCLSEKPGDTCGDVCADYDATCVANGCSGFTGLLFNIGFDGYCDANTPPFEAVAGGCDELIDYTPQFPGEGFTTYAACCCT